MRSNVETTRWLKMYLDIGLQLQVQKNISLEKARRAKDWIRRLKSTYSLEPGLI